MELVSIIIPVYNIEKYLKECIDSLRFQTYRNIEIILVNDGSTDNSAKLCDDFALLDNRIVVIHKENGGVSSARNIGIDTAKGEYITFVDGDDWVDSKYIETLYKSIKNENADVSAVGFMYQYNDGKTKPLVIAENTIVITAEEALNQACDAVRPWVGFACGKLVRKNIIIENDIKFDTGIKICEDSLFWYTTFEKSDIVVKNKELMYHYRIRETSATRTSRKLLNNLRTKISAFEKALVIADRHPGTTFQYRVRTTLISDMISYISAMFALKQYDKAEIQSIKRKIMELKDPQIISALGKGVKIRYDIFSFSPRVLYLFERVKATVRW